MSIKLRRYAKNTVRAFVDLELSRVGLVLRDCRWHENNREEWVSFAARSYEGDDGVTRWQPLIEYAEGAKEARQALAAIHAAVAEQERGRP
jgi:hypothetical protein